MNLEENTPQETPKSPEPSSENWEVEADSAPVEPSPWEEPMAEDDDSLPEGAIAPLGELQQASLESDDEADIPQASDIWDAESSEAEAQPQDVAFSEVSDDEGVSEETADSSSMPQAPSEEASEAELDESPQPPSASDEPDAEASPQPPLEAEVAASIPKPEISAQPPLEAEVAASIPEPEISPQPPTEAKEPQPSPEVIAVPDLDVLENRAQQLKDEIAQLEAAKAELQQAQAQLQMDLGRLVQDGVSELKKRKQALTVEIEQLERRQQRIREEMRTSFAGVSQDIAVRVQGFKNYLVGSLQDLSAAAEQLNIEPPPPATSAQSAPPPRASRSRDRDRSEAPPKPQFAEQGWKDQQRFIRRLLDQYRNNPDYYGPPWQLRRTFEPVHADRVSNWFLSQGGRGAIKSTNSRLQNILIASAAASVLHAMYGKRLRVLVLANTPERLGEWRRGLQDCLGISRADFGPDRGVALFEAPEPLAQRADRLTRSGQVPLIIVDESENQLNLSLLQFPLWLAFAPDPESNLVREW